MARQAPSSFPLLDSVTTGPAAPRPARQAPNSMDLLDAPIVGPMFRLTGGVAVGLSENAIIGRVLEWAPAMVRQRVEDLRRRLHGSTIADLGEIIGEYGPDVAIGAGLFTLGRAGAVHGGRALLGGAELAGEGRAARAVQQFTKRATEQKLPGQELAEMADSTPPGVIERGLQIAGGSAGIGAQFGAIEAAEGGEVDQIVRQALLGVGLTFGLETGLTLGAKAAFKGAREPATAEIRQRFRDLTGQLKDDFLAREQSKAINFAKAIEAGLRVEPQLLSLQRKLLGEAGVKDFIPEDLAKQLSLIDRKIDKVRATRISKQRGIAAAQTRISAVERELLGDPKNIAILFGKKLSNNHDDVRSAVQNILLKTLKTPEGIRDELGVSVANLVTTIGHAENEKVVGRAIIEALVDGLQGRAAHLLNVGKKEARDGAFFLPYINALEKGGLKNVETFALGKGLTPRQAKQVTEIVSEMDGVVETFVDDLISIGALPSNIRDKLGQHALARLFPHIPAPVDDAAYYAQRVKAHMERYNVSEEKAMLALTRAEKFPNISGLARYGDIEPQLSSAGSLMDKLNLGEALEANPFRALVRFATDAQHRLSYSSRVGVRGELADLVKQAAVKEGANPGLVNTMVDTLLSHKIENQGLVRLGQTMLDLQTGTKLTTAVVLNAFQPLNNVTVDGFSRSIRALANNVKHTNRTAVGPAAGVFDSVHKAMLRTFRGQVVRENFPDRLADWTLRGTGFSAVENWNRSWAASTTQLTIGDYLGLALAGRLKGASLDRARRHLAQLGLNLSEKVKLAKLIAAREGIPLEKVQVSQLFRPPRVNRGVVVEVGEFDTVTFQGVKLTQFAPDITRRPLIWNHPIGRVVFQFKTFALGQARLIRDQVVNEAAKGNMKPLAYFLSLYPVAGEVAGDIRSLIKKRDRKNFDHPLMRLVDNVLTVGGIGIASDAMVQAHHGRLAEWVIGPTASDLLTLFSSILTRDTKPLWQQMQRLPATQAATFLAEGGYAAVGYTVGELMEQVDKLRSGGPGPDTTMSPQDFMEALRENSE